jgi:hypothetical protein
MSKLARLRNTRGSETPERLDSAPRLEGAMLRVGPRDVLDSSESRRPTLARRKGGRRQGTGPD